MTAPDGTQHKFEITPVSKRCLINGLDDVGRTEEFQGDIDAFRVRYRDALPFQAAIAKP